MAMDWWMVLCHLQALPLGWTCLIVLLCATWKPKSNCPKEMPQSALQATTARLTNQHFSSTRKPVRAATTTSLPCSWNVYRKHKHNADSSLSVYQLLFMVVHSTKVIFPISKWMKNGKNGWVLTVC
jgi:hypothetical protein